MKRLTIFLVLTLCCSVAMSAAKKKSVKKSAPPTLINASGFAGIAPGATKAQAAAKGFVCKEVHIGDYITLTECRKAMTFADKIVEGYAQMNSSGNKVEAVGFDTYFPGDQIGPAQDQFYAFEKEVESMLGVKPTSTPTPDTYLAMTNFEFPKTIVSCYLYSDDRTKPPRLRCGAEVRTKK